ncbi:MAG: hypothetical protein KA144_16300 [Xanthomonadaceae bacterium]|nr:hypothetical protein [Xanthomonadaceae bacterium]
MLKPGTLVGDALDVGSMAHAIELAMIAQGMLDLDEETPDAAENRRKTFIAISTGIVNHLKANLDVRVVQGKFGNSIPAAATTLSGANGDIS